MAVRTVRVVRGPGTPSLSSKTGVLTTSFLVRFVVIPIAAINIVVLLISSTYIVGINPEGSEHVLPEGGATSNFQSISSEAQSGGAMLSTGAGETLQKMTSTPSPIARPSMIQVEASGLTLPSAKALLTKAAPFRAPDMIKLSDNLISSPNTIVTGYFRVRSKYKPEKYNGWMKNMLSLQDAMVIYTQADFVDQVKELRSHAKNRTVIIPLETEELPFGTLYSEAFWQDQLDRDPEKKRHQSYQLFWIWLSKSWLTMQVIELNVYQSDLFMWSDIGCFRDQKYNSKTIIQHREMVPPAEMIQMAHHKPNPPAEELFNDKYDHKPNFYHSGSQFAAYKDTWVKFHDYFLDTIDRFLMKNMIIVEDQAILQSVCLQHPEICAYVPFSEVQDNHYFGLRYVLHNGGSYKYWRHPKAIGAKG